MHRMDAHERSYGTAPRAVPLTVTSRATRTGHLLDLSGEFDHETAPAAQEALTALPLRAGQVLVLDLSGVTFCDSSGLNALLTARTLATAASATVALAAVPDHLVRVLDTVGLTSLFTLLPAVPATQEDAHPTP